MSSPMTLEEFQLACEDLSLGEAMAEKHRLQNSISHLLRSNHELQEFLNEQEDNDLRVAVEENEVVIETQRSRIVMLESRIKRLVDSGVIEAKEGETEEAGQEKGIYL